MVDTRWNKDRVLLVKWIITIIVTLFIFMLPTSELWTDDISKFFTITIFCVMLFAFNLFETTYIALAIPVFYIVSGVATPQIAFGGWTQSTVWMMIAAVILGDIIDATGLLKRIVYWFMSKSGGSYMGLLWAMVFAGIILAYLAPNAGAALFFVLAYSICRSLNIQKYSALAVVLFYTAHIAGNAAPILLTYDAMFDAGISLCQVAFPELNLNVTYMDYAMHNIIHLPLVLILCYVPAKLWHVNKEKIEMNDVIVELNKMGPITKQEKKAVFLLLVLMILFFTQELTGFAVYLCFMITLLVSFLPGLDLGNAEILKNANYQIAFFISGCLSIGIVGNYLGVGGIVGNLLMPMLGENILQMSVMSFLFGYIINLLLTPMAGISIMALPLAEFCTNAGIYPVPLLYMVINGLNQTLFPYESAAYVLLYSFDMITMKQFMQIFTVRTVITLLYNLCVSLPYWNFIGLFNGPISLF